MKPRKIIAAGTIFSDWTVLKEIATVTTTGGTKKRMFRARCKCGNVKTVQLNNLIAKTSQRCCECGAKIRAAKMRGPRKPDGTVNKKCAYGRYRQGAKKRNLVFDLSFAAFLTLAAQNCYYCNSPPANCYNLKHSKGAQRGKPRAGAAFIHNGIDRVDSAQGYLPDNCVSCCRRCNIAKSNMTTIEFYEWVNAVHAHIKRSKRGTSLPPRSI